MLTDRVEFSLTERQTRIVAEALEAYVRELASIAAPQATVSEVLATLRAIPV